MSFRLSKQQTAEREEIVKRLSSTRDDLNGAVDKFNDEMIGAWSKVESAIEAHNSAIVDAKAFCDNVAAEAESEADDKSDKWQESDRGTSVRDWISEWENIDLSEVDMSMPDEASVDVSEYSSDVEALPEEADQVS